MRIAFLALSLSVVLVSPAFAIGKKDTLEQCGKIKSETIRDQCCEALHDLCLHDNCPKTDSEIGSTCSWEIQDACKIQENLCKGKPEEARPAGAGMPAEPGKVLEPAGGATQRKVPAPTPAPEAR